MIMGILLLLVADILIMIGYLIKRKFKVSLLLSIPIIVFTLFVMWFFTSVPVSLEIVKLPVIELIRVRAICPDDSLHFDIEYESGVIELLADKRLEDVNGGYLLFAGMEKPDFSYEDIYEDVSSKDIILQSAKTFFVRKQNGKFLYMVAFHPENQTPELQSIKKNIYCKMFFVQMLSPIYETNEIAVPGDSLRKVVIP